MQTFRHQLAGVMFRVTLIPWILFFKFFLHWKTEYKDVETKRIKEGPVLVVMNHVSWMDPFIGGCAIPNVFPIRYITNKRFFKMPIIGQMLWLYGCIKLEKKDKLEGALSEALGILKDNHTVGIFPEGKIRKAGRPRKARRGAGFLAQQTNPVIIPVYIDGLFNVRASEVFLRKRYATIFVGAPFHLPEDVKDFREGSEYIVDRLRELRA